MKVFAIFILFAAVLIGIYIYNQSSSSSSDCVNMSDIHTSELKVVPNDENDICPLDLTIDDFSPTDNNDINKNCFYFSMKDSSGKDIKFNAYCFYNIYYDDHDDKSIKELNARIKKCGIQFCDNK